MVVFDLCSFYLCSIARYLQLFALLAMYYYRVLAETPEAELLKRYFVAF